MPDVFAWIQNNLSLTALLGLVVAFAIPRVRDWVLTGVLGYAWLKITDVSRAAVSQETRKSARRERLRSALTMLTEGLSDALTSYDTQIKIQRAITVLRAEGSADLAADLDKIIPTIHGEQELLAVKIRALVDPIIEKLRRDLSGDA